MAIGSLVLVFFRIYPLLLFQVSQVCGSNFPYDMRPPGEEQYRWNGTGENLDNDWMDDPYQKEVEMTKEECIVGQKISLTCSPSVLKLRPDIHVFESISIGRPPLKWIPAQYKTKTNIVAEVQFIGHPRLSKTPKLVYNDHKRPWHVQFENVPNMDRVSMMDQKSADEFAARLKQFKNYNMSITWTIEKTEPGDSGLYLCYAGYIVLGEEFEKGMLSVYAGGHQRINCANATTNTNKPPHVHQHGDAAKLGASFVLPILLVILLTLRPLFD